MSQDSFRSMYRSFVTCDDPDGIVECKTIRRSKAAKKLGGKIKNAKLVQNFVASSQKETRKEASSTGSIDKLDSSCSVQLKEVSKGAQKLVEVADSVSKNTLERKSEDIAKDLLKGAVSLQESLKMLGKMQEATKFLTGCKKKEKSADRMSLQRSSSARCTDHSNVIEFQKRRLSADGGSSKDCYDELREAIRESFERQDLLQKGSSDRKECAERKVESSVDTASACSSQSSMFNSHDFISSDSSSSNVQSEKPKGSNCIAKLMGLDELTSKRVQSISMFTNKRPILDLDLPIARKPSIAAYKAKPDHRTLKEIIEIMQSKGLMGGKSFDKQAQKRYPSDVPDESPPIVLMKPLHSSRIDKDCSYIHNCTCGRASANTKERLKLPMMRDDVSSKNVDPREALNNSTMKRKAIADKHVVTGISQEKATKSFREARTRPKDKESEIQNSSNRSPIRPRASSHVTSHLQKGEVIEKRVDKIHRVAPNMKNDQEKNQVKESGSGRFTASRANHQEKTNTKMMNRSSIESIASNNQLPQQPSTISKSRTAKALPGSVKQKKPTKSDKLSDQRIPVAVENMGNCPNDTEINPNVKNEDCAMKTRLSLDHGVSDVCTRDDTKQSSESTELIIEQDLGAKCDQIDNSEVNCILNRNESRKSQITVRDVVSSSRTLLNHAEKLFDITTCQSVVLEATSFDDDDLQDAKLIFDCATELLECKWQQWELTVYPLLQHPKKRPKISVSYERLVGRICDEIGKLKDNSRVGGDELVIDDFNVKLKRDLWCNGAAGGAWDLGWMRLFSWDEVEQVVVDIAEHLLCVIVEELLSDFLV